MYTQKEKVTLRKGFRIAISCVFPKKFLVNNYEAGLKITDGQRTMSGLIVGSKENTIVSCSFYISGVFVNVQYGKKCKTVGYKQMRRICVPFRQAKI